MARHIIIGPDHHLTPEVVSLVAHNPSVRVSLSAKSRREVKRSRMLVDEFVAKGKRTYGVTTGFGKLKDVAISREDTAELQLNLIRSHSAGVGEPLPLHFVRAALLVRINSLSQGYSGVRLELLDRACQFLNKNVIPVVPSQGSVGASGDLAPLSHMGLLFFGEGEAWYKGKKYSGAQALRRARIKPLPFTAKEGLAWNNGTSVMLGMAALAVYEAQYLTFVGDMCCALSLEAFCGTIGAFRPEIHVIRPHPGQIESAKNIRTFVRGSKLVDSIKNRLQDSYSIRCAPQVHGAVRDAVTYIASAVERELNSVTDNPLVFPRLSRITSGGNFHGEPLAIPMDVLGIVLAELANISERRTAKLVDPATSEGLPAFLIKPEKVGLHNGLMIPQYTAAALVSENKVLAHPASVDSIPTSANQEDHVSMGSIATRKAWKIIDNVRNVLAIELLSATQGVDFRGARKLGKGTKATYQRVRKVVPYISKDRRFDIDIKKIETLLLRRTL